MGDWAQSIVDVDVKGDEAAELGERLTAWLVDTGVIASELTDCVLGSPVGHPPGTHYAARDRCHRRPAEPVAQRCRDRRWPHRVLHDGSAWRDVSEVWSVRGARVGGQPLPHDVRYRDERLVLRYRYRGHQLFELRSRQWAQRLGLGSAPVRFGELGVTFWNWHPLAREFVAEVGGFLGHRVVYNDHKL